MAKPTVTMKLTPSELQIIDAALEYYKDAAKAILHKLDAPGRPRIFDGDAAAAVRMASLIRQDIGLK